VLDTPQARPGRTLLAEVPGRHASADAPGPFRPDERRHAGPARPDERRHAGPLQPDDQDLRADTQLCRRVAPASPDFSGWNWVAASGPFSTAETKRSPPYSVQPTFGATDSRAPVSCQSRTPYECTK